jgi:hypothetical protein
MARMASIILVYFLITCTVETIGVARRVVIIETEFFGFEFRCKKLNAHFTLTITPLILGHCHFEKGSG